LFSALKTKGEKMHENDSASYEGCSDEAFTPRQMLGLAATMVILVLIAAAGAIYGFHQQSAVSQLTTRNSELNASLNQMQEQLNRLTSKLDDLTAVHAPVVAPQAAASKTSPSPAASHPTHVPSSRMKQMQTQITDLGKKLKDTQESLAEARSEMENDLDSTRDQLNGSIARNHEELVVLEQRGERNYFEFDLAKSKDFQRTGPISMSLRKADPKHRSYDVVVLVDDNQLAKRKVDLYEPIWITSDDSQPLQVVVNKIDKNQVRGYVSAPKYPETQLISVSASQQEASSNAANSRTSNNVSAPAGTP
jgi:uncharacterized coiled-coil protein SlyX